MKKSKTHMDSTTYAAFSEELCKIAASKIKSNDPMPSASKANVNAFMDNIRSWDSPHRDKALALASDMSEPKLFEMLHSMRRWYTGQTMVHNLVKNKDQLQQVMQLKPADTVGIYRGFKVSNDNPLAKLTPGQKLVLPVTRNRGVSSWSTTEAPTNKFSGGGKGKTGIIVKLVDSKGVQPLIAPPTHTKEWFNALYERSIGKSFRPKEGEYLLAAPEVHVEVVKVKK